MKRIGVLVVAYNASSTLAQVLDRIPHDVRRRMSDILVCDDHSDDATYLVGLGYGQVRTDLPLTVVRHSRNLGYGGNQKAGYQWAIEHGLDIVVLIHGDGQYAPEYLPQILEPLERDKADAVFGSRMIEPGAARKGWDASLQVRRQPDPHSGAERGGGLGSQRVAFRLPRLQRRRPA
jgi:glycosyltransferase involved in cell wall biosynthesis